MFIGHLPASYILGRMLVKYQLLNKHHRKFLIALIMIGGVFPDIDLLYFYTAGERRVVHHEYWTHIPFYWAAIYVFLSVLLLAFRKISIFKNMSVFFLGIALHLALDTIAGQIQWLYPISTQGYNLVVVPSNHSWWVFNFLIHWTFAVEIFVLVFAAMLLLKRRKA